MRQQMWEAFTRREGDFPSDRPVIQKEIPMGIKEIAFKHIKKNKNKINEAETTRSQLKWLRVSNTRLLASFSLIDLQYLLKLSKQWTDLRSKWRNVG